MKKYHKNQDKRSQILSLKQLSQNIYEFTYRNRPLIMVYPQNKPRKFQKIAANALTPATIKFYWTQDGSAERINSWLRQDGVKNKKLSQTNVHKKYRGLIKHLGGIGIIPSPLCGLLSSFLNSK